MGIGYIKYIKNYIQYTKTHSKYNESCKWEFRPTETSPKLEGRPHSAWNGTQYINRSGFMTKWNGKEDNRQDL